MSCRLSPPPREIPSYPRRSRQAQEALRSHLERKGGFYTILVSGV